MQFDWWTFTFQAVNLLVLMWLLGRFLFRPIAGIIARREAETRQTLEAAAESQRQAKAAQTAADAERASIAAERQSLIQTARQEADVQRKDILDAAREDAARLTETMADAARRRAAEGEQDRDRRIVSLAVTITGRLLNNLPADGRIAGYIDRLNTALCNLTPAQHRAFDADRDTLRLTAARALTPTEHEQAIAALQAAFKTDLSPPVAVDPDLIAGLELQGRHSILHNSLRHDLDAIAAALTSHADD